MTSKQIGQLYEDYLAMWRDINRTKWLMEIDKEQYTENERINVYNARNNFLLQCVQEFDIDDSRRWQVSEVTGTIAYLDEGGEDDEKKDSVGEGRDSEPTVRRGGEGPDTPRQERSTDIQDGR